MPLLPLSAGLWLLACAPPRLPDPVVDAVQPSFAYNAEDEPVTIVGEHFWPEVTIDAGTGRAELDRSYRAWITGPDGSPERHELVGVGILDDRHLSATVAAGFAPGAYALSVEGPTGGRAELRGSFLVTDEQAAYLDVGSERSEYAITEAAPVQIALADLGGDTVMVDFEVTITAALDDGYGTIDLQAGTLDSHTVTSDGARLRGFLRDGVATVYVRPSAPDNVTVTVSPADPDSHVIAGSYDLDFDPGDGRLVRLQLPLSDGVPEFVAGEPFDLLAEVTDQYGNPVAGPTTVTLGTRCSDWFESDVVLEGLTIVEVVPRHVTSSVPGDSCDLDHVYVVSGGPVGESDPFEVLAGPTDHFLVLPAAGPHVAGDPFSLSVQPEDVFGNLSSWTGVLTLDDNGHGLVGTSCFEIGPTRVCSTTATVADPADVIVATGDDGTTGSSVPFVVSPDDVATSATVTATGPATAGVPLPVEVRAFDAWGNLMDAALLGVGAITVGDELSEASCASTGFLPDGAATFDCSLFTARVGATLTAELPAFGVSASAPSFGVTNGALAVVRFSGEQAVQAGQDIPLTVFAEDGFGNRYVQQTDPTLELTDDTGTFSLASVTLLPDGTAGATGFVTLAGTTSVHASQGGVALGSSVPFPVSPGVSASVLLTPLEPWAWRDVPVDVQVETVDLYGNRTDNSGAAALTSTTTASPAVPLTLVNGVGTAAFTWTATAFVDVLRGDMGALTGTVDVVVARDCGLNGPVPVLTFGGFTEAIACVDAATGTAPVIADLSGSVAGNRAITGYAAARSGGVTVADTQPILELELPGTGAYALHGLAFASNGCGAEVAATGWAGPDDDTPVGPLTLTTLAVDVPVWTLLAPVTIDLVGAVDCSRDPAASQEVHLRTTAGTLIGPALSGAGPVVVLDAAGDGSVDLETTGLLSDGTVEVHAWVGSGAAGGRLELPLVGDSLRPVVIAQDPAGLHDGIVDELAIMFSEPMLGSSLTNLGNWSIGGPSPVSVLSVVASGNDAILTLDPPPDGAAALWTVTAMNLRDEAGNLLAGSWTASANPYGGAFGGSGGPPAPLACTAFAPAGLAIRPDGDDGLDAEADLLEVDVSSAVAPAWWVVEVTDAAGVLVHEDWTVPIGPVDTVSWDGRGFDGVVVPNGSYALDVQPDDGLGNRGVGCAATVTVDNRAGAAP